MGKRWIGLLVLMLFFASFLLIGTKSANGVEYVSMCVNKWAHAEIIECDIDYSNYNATVHWNGANFYCSINMSDEDNDTNLTMDIGMRNISNISQVLPSFINGTQVGNISYINYTASLDDWGSYWLFFGVDDNKGCARSKHHIWINLTINGNRPPVQMQDLPDVSFKQKTVLIPFDLDNYFYDPDNDSISYSVYNPPTDFTVEVLGSNQIQITSPNFCGIKTVYFNITDEHGLSILSNPVNVSVECITERILQSGSSSSGGGGGGSASGKSTLVDQTGYSGECVTDYFCTQWSKCLPVGKKTRECVDIRSCNEKEKRRIEIKDCVYVPTCSDGVKNGFEEEIDCGGPDCPSCEQVSCSDGLMNGLETAIDCGGPNCPVCPTCFDNIQNRDEKGIDCGGTYCQPCDNIIVSDILPKNDYFTRVLMGVMLGVVVLLTLLKFFYGYIDWFLTKFMFLFSKKKRRIIVKSEIKDVVLRRLSALEANIDKVSLSKLSVEFSQIVRYFFKEVLALNYEFTYNELLERLKEAKIDELLKKVLLMFFKRSLGVEFSGYVLTITELRALIDEFRELVLQTSVLTLEDVKNMRKDITYHDISEKIPVADRIYLEISNAQLSLKHGEFVDAVTGYKSALKEYEILDGIRKGVVYPDINRLYLEILLRDKRSIL